MVYPDGDFSTPFFPFCLLFRGMHTSNKASISTHFPCGCTPHPLVYFWYYVGVYTINVPPSPSELLYQIVLLYLLREGRREVSSGTQKTVLELVGCGCGDPHKMHTFPSTHGKVQPVKEEPKHREKDDSGVHGCKGDITQINFVKN